MTETALIQSGKIMNDFMVFAAAMENFGSLDIFFFFVHLLLLAPAANSCKKKQEPEPPYQVKIIESIVVKDS